MERLLTLRKRMEMEKKRVINYLEVKKEMEILEDIKEFWEREERKINQKAGKDEVVKAISRRQEDVKHPDIYRD